MDKFLRRGNGSPWSRFRTPPNAPDQPDAEREQQHQPPEANQAARCPFCKTVSGRKQDQQKNRQRDQRQQPKNRPAARRDHFGCVCKSSMVTIMFEVRSSPPTTTGEIPSHFSTICQRTKAGLSRNALPRI